MTAQRTVPGPERPSRSDSGRPSLRTSGRLRVTPQSTPTRDLCRSCPPRRLPRPRVTPRRKRISARPILGIPTSGDPAHRSLRSRPCGVVHEPPEDVGPNVHLLVVAVLAQLLEGPPADLVHQLVHLACPRRQGHTFSRGVVASGPALTTLLLMAPLATPSDPIATRSTKWDPPSAGCRGPPGYRFSDSPHQAGRFGRTFVQLRS